MGNKKTVVKHKIVNGYTVCGRYVGSASGRFVGLGSKIRGNKTWRGVTCLRCLAVRAKATKKTTKKTTVKVTAGTGGV